MQMQFLLSFWIDSFAGVLMVVDQSPDCTILLNGEHRHVASQIEGDIKQPAFGINADVCRTETCERHCAKEFESIGFWIDT